MHPVRCLAAQLRRAPTRVASRKPSPQPTSAFRRFAIRARNKKGATDVNVRFVTVARTKLRCSQQPSLRHSPYLWFLWPLVPRTRLATCTWASSNWRSYPDCLGGEPRTNVPPGLCTPRRACRNICHYGSAHSYPGMRVEHCWTCAFPPCWSSQGTPYGRSAVEQFCTPLDDRLSCSVAVLFG
jgi:hypothetical protein